MIRWRMEANAEFANRRIGGKEVFEMEENVEVMKDDNQERECDYCHGTGGDPWNDGVLVCPECDGAGYKWWPPVQKTPAPCVTREATGYVLMPTKLTAENGAKEALMGEFSVPFPISCPVCHGDDEYCKECTGTGEVKLNVNVSWTVIKDIYAKAVNLLGT